MAESLSTWQREWAGKVAAAHPITPAAGIRATGNSLAAQNDESDASADPMQWAFDQVHLLRIEAARTSNGDARTIGRIAGYSEVLEVLRAARGRAGSAK